MTTAKSQRIILAAGLLTFGIGFVNSLLRDGRPPTRRFLVGSAIAFFGISALSEVEPEIATPLALAVLTTALLGDGGGVLAQITPRRELDTTPGKPLPADVENKPTSEHGLSRTGDLHTLPLMVHPDNMPIIVAGIRGR